MARGMAVLESFDTERQRLNATLTAQRTGLTRATARRHLLTLAHLGYLETDGQYYWLSAKVLGFAGSYLSGARLPRAVQPTLHQLSLATQLSCSVAVLQNDAVIIVARGIWQGQICSTKPVTVCWRMACTWGLACLRMPRQQVKFCWPT